MDLSAKPFTAVTLHKMLVELMEVEEKVTHHVMWLVKEVTTPWIKRVVPTTPSFLKFSQGNEEKYL